MCFSDASRRLACLCLLAIARTAGAEQVVSLGLLTPLGAASDIEFRLSSDDSDTVGQATTFSVFLYFYGD